MEEGREQFKFIDSACRTVWGDQIPALRMKLGRERAMSEAWGLGLLMGDWFELDHPQSDVLNMIEALRDGLPRWRLDPDVANEIIEGALMSLSMSLAHTPEPENV